MKTYNLFYAFMALLVIGCNKSDDGSGSEKEKSKAADYILLVDDGSTLYGTFLKADANTLEINAGNGGFEAVTKPQFTFEDRGILSIYTKNTDCSGTIVIHDFNGAISDNYEVFTDMPSCKRTASAIAHTGNAIYIAYENEVSADETEYFIRIVDVSTDKNAFVDVEIEQRAVDLAFANNRLFVLTFDGTEDAEYKMSVIKADTFDIVHNMDLGVDVKRIFRNPAGNIIIGYPNLHTTLNSSTMAFEHTKYGEDTEPNFFQSRFRQFDTTGKMYYGMPSGSHSTYPIVAAIYDFDTNNTIIYAYENFLTETQLSFEYEIKSTTMVAYDEKNNILIIGYSKLGQANKGGMLRIKLGTKPKLIDNLDLDGTPYALFIK